MKKLLFPILAAAVLLGIVGVQLYAAWLPEPERPEREPLEAVLPDAIEGWQVEDRELGETESVIERSRSLLGFDDFVYRVYRGPVTTFSVYVAYWSPGKMPVRLVNQHTPDRCWTEVGWTCTEREWSVERSAGGTALQPAQWGTYTHGDHEQTTYFWHIVGGEAFWYGGERINTHTAVSTIFENFLKFGFNQNREQFFVRVIYDGDREALWQDPGFNRVMQDLAELCLGVPEGQREET